MNWTIWVVILSAAAFAQTEKQKYFPDCNLDGDSFSNADANVRKKYPKASSDCSSIEQEGNNSSGGADLSFRECLPSSGQLEPCSPEEWDESKKDEIKRQPDRKGITTAFDKDINAKVRGANCVRRSDLCMRKTHFRAMKKNPCGIDLQKKARKPEDEQTRQYLLEQRAIFMEASACLREQGKALEEEAFKSLDGGNEARNQKADIYCEEKGGEFRLCRYDHDGSTPSRDLNPDDPNDVRSAPKNNPRAVATFVGKSGKMYCSGTVLGDNETVHTAAHCPKGQKTVSMRVFDKNGESHYLSANCEAGSWDQSGNDTTTCKLSRPVDAGPTYAMIRNNSVKECFKSGWTWQCPDHVLTRDFTGKRTSILAAPSGYLNYAEGYMYYDPSTGSFFHNAFTEGGSSGGGLIVPFRGDQVVIANNVAGAEYRFHNRAKVPSIEELNKMKIPYLPQSTLQNGAYLFREMEMGLNQ